MLADILSILPSLNDVVKLHAEKTALVHESEKITFEQLNIQSNKLANHLKSKGINTDTPICFCLDQSIEKVVVMLSIWKAGGAYVSLDPLYPEARLQHILDDTDSPVLITTKAFSDKFPSYSGELILIDEQRAEIEEWPDKMLYSENEDGLAYLAYTSGSTGTPKAVMAEHKGLGNFISGFGAFLNASEEDTALNISSSNFDGIVLDLWVPLSLGMTVFLYPDNRIVGEPLLQYIRENEISILPYLPISILATLPIDQPIGRLRKVCTGGEAPVVQVIDHWKKKTELINIYGPTETTVVVSGFEFNESHPISTIGKPLPNVCFYVLDEEMNSLPANEVGELYIGGIQVSRGYYNQPELTAERFLDFTTPEGITTRVYKTGDLVRRLADDTIEFVGRADQQLKIRGFRVEPAEIEENILRSGLVENCIIIIREEQNEKQLICFYKNVKNRNTFPEDLRAYLFEQLPPYMIPSRFLEIETFPLTANGKIDKFLLKSMALAEEKRKSFTAPQTELQQQLALLWSTVLDMKTVGIHDNFFQFGGNSILAYKLMIRIREKLQLNFQIADLFLHPTIHDLEQSIIQKDFEENDAVISPDENKLIPLSAQQQALWFLNQLHGSVAYNIGALYPISREVSLTKLENAIRKLLKKHPVLRSVIEEKNALAHTVEINENNWMLQTLYNSENLQELLQIPFDLERDYMLRAYVIHQNDQPQSLFLMVHHLVTDGWTMPLIVEEINALYSENSNDESIASSAGYKDYQHWQQNQNNDEGIHFWKNYLEDVQVLQIATDFKKQYPHPDSGEQFQFEIDEELTSALNNISEEQSTTLYTTLISAFGLLMQYYSGQSDICIGSPFANRPYPFNKTIGYFANMLPVRMKIDGNPAFSEFLRQNRNLMPTIFQYQHVPLETIISHVITNRFAGHNPLFQTIFVLQQPIEAGENTQPVNREKIEWIFNGRTKFDLQFEALPLGKKLKFNIDYSNALFSEKTILEMARCFQLILKSIALDPNKKIGDIALNSTLVDSQDCLSEEGETVKTFIELFEEQVEKTPQNTAFVFSGKSVSYNELNEKSGKVAELLIASGIKNGDFVACFQKQSIERVITLLGIMKAGGAYVPLDITYPIDRIKTILDDTRAKALITSEEIEVGNLEMNTPVLLIEHLLSTPVDNIRKRFSGTHSPSDLAYVIHTSGTTGTPKGVLIEHQSLGNFVAEYGNLLELKETDHTLQFSPYNFDGSVIDLWIPLTKGATIHLYPNNQLLGDHLAEFLSLHAISAIPFISPSVLSTVPPFFELPSLRIIGTGAETCPPSVSNYWKQRVKLFNMYGPTESTVAVNHFVFDEAHPGNTIGTAIKNMQLYVLDQYLRPVPNGVIGDLYISGIQLSRGYLNQAELTAEKFLQNPFYKDKNSIYSKIYQTGDRAKMLPDGLIEYMGRADHQVKIRGYRIELAEIEHVLCLIAGIKNASVQVHTSTENITSLRAFVTGISDIQFIKSELGKKLPAYMIPNEFFIVDAIPLNSNGKVDLRSLHLMAEKYDPETNEVEEEPANEYEKIIKEVWTEVLQCNIKSMEADFFHLGGHSLLLTKLYNKLFKHFPNKLSLSELYVNSSIRKLALLVQERYASPDTSDYALGMDPLSDEIKKDATIAPDRFQFNVSKKGNFEQPEAVLLTGVTGFVGVNLLVELLQSNAATIYLLIRAGNEDHARIRVLEALESQWIPAKIYDEKRIKLLAGDLAKPFLGLTSERYDELTQVIDVVYHAGSSVNFIQPYAYMKSANVDALHTLIQFVTTNKLKQLSLLSTVGVFSWEHYFTKTPLIKEDTNIGSAFKYLSRDMGYIQSKWVMEQVAQEAIKQGVPIIIFRLGYVFCHSLTGATAKYQWWSSLIKTCIQLKCYPLLIDQKEELTMVDFVSKAVVHISKKPEATGEIFHLSPAPENNITVTDFFEFLRQEFNFDLQPVPYQEWLKLWENDEESPLYPLLNLFKFKAYDNKAIIEIHQNTPDFDISNTNRFLKDSQIENTVVTRENVAAFCKYLGVLE
ncbi:Linear gramicidin synthase subunit D [compost metagenome]